MEKTFGCTKTGEKIYRVCVSASKLIENADGSIIKDLIIDDIKPLDDFYKLLFTLSDGSHVRACRNNTIIAIETTPDERLKHPMALFYTFYSQNRKTLLQMVSKKLKENIDRMNALKTEALKISNSCIVSINIAESLCELFPDEEEKVMTEEEFASMALA